MKRVGGDWQEPVTASSVVRSDGNFCASNFPSAALDVPLNTHIKGLLIASHLCRPLATIPFNIQPATCWPARPDGCPLSFVWLIQITALYSPANNTTSITDVFFPRQTDTIDSDTLPGLYVSNSLTKAANTRYQ